MTAVLKKNARVYVIHEVVDPKAQPNAWRLCLQWCRYAHTDGRKEHGYRFIWRRPNGTLQAARGQARIQSLSQVMDLFSEANRLGWGHNVGEGYGQLNLGDFNFRALGENEEEQETLADLEGHEEYLED